MIKKTKVILLAGMALSSCGNPAEDAVRKSMIDGESARFREVTRCTAAPEIYTGEVNGKNRMGAYVGFAPFFVEGNAVYFAGDDQFLPVMKRCYGDVLSDDATEAGIGATDSGSPTDSASPVDAVKGAWVTDVDVDPIDDSKRIIVSLPAKSGSSRFDGPVDFVARCASNSTQVYAIWHDYVGDDSNSVYDEYKRIEVRVGDAPARTERWSVSTDKEATFAPSAIELLRKMKGAKRLVLRTTPYNEAPVTAVFDLEGFDEAIGPIAEECGWTFDN